MVSETQAPAQPKVQLPGAWPAHLCLLGYCGVLEALLEVLLCCFKAHKVTGQLEDLHHVYFSQELGKTAMTSGPP